MPPINSDFDPKLAAGPGVSEDNGEDPKPMLQGFTEYEWVNVHNPLSVDFVGMFGITKPAPGASKFNATQLVRTQEDIGRMYGLNLDNPSHQSTTKIFNRAVIRAGQTVRMLGNEAQIIVRQLVNEILQREGFKNQLANAHLRRNTEERVVRGTGSIRDFHSVVPVQEQLQSAVQDAQFASPYSHNPAPPPAIPIPSLQEVEFPEVMVPSATVAAPPNGSPSPQVETKADDPSEPLKRVIKRRAKRKQI